MKQILLQITLGVVLITAIILVATNAVAYDKPFKQIELSSNNKIVNTVSVAYLDTIISVGLDEIGIVGVTVVISELSENAKGQFNGELKAHVRFFDGVYYLFIDKFGRNESMQVIAHEIIHINQYNTGKLYYSDNGQLSWDDELFEIGNIDYDKRPWEREAFSGEGQMYSNIHDKLVED